jgi:integrase/recombinase XerD
MNSASVSQVRALARGGPRQGQLLNQVVQPACSGYGARSEESHGIIPKNPMILSDPGKIAPFAEVRGLVKVIWKNSNLPIPMQFADAVEPYLTYCRAEKLNSPQTTAKYRDCFRTWLIPHLGAKDLDKLNRMDVLSLRRELVAKGLGVSSQYTIIIVLKSFLRFCGQVLHQNCLGPNEVTLPKRGKPDVITLTPEEIEKLLANINPSHFTGARLRALIELLLATGMRISEALSLDRAIFDAGVRETEIVGKGGKRRTIFLTDRCYFWIKHYFNMRYDDHPALFVTTGFKPARLCREDISRFFIDLRGKAGVQKKVTPHILRHTYCTNLLNNGADITFIKELAGHQDIHTTAKYYLGVDKAQLRRVVDKYLHYDLPGGNALDESFQKP